MSEKPILMSGPMVRAILDGRKTQTRRVIKPQQELPDHWWATDVAEYCPFGKPGDHLWVRETWAAHYMYDPIKPSNILGCLDCDPRPALFFSADDSVVGQCDSVLRGKWRPSIHMPRWTSRLTLRITSVGVQRLQGMNAAAAQREGFGMGASGYLKFQKFWDQLNAKRGYGWETNPWVWVLEFNKHD